MWRCVGVDLKKLIVGSTELHSETVGKQKGTDARSEDDDPSLRGEEMQCDCMAT
jgi:hypothetical protein